MVNQRCPPDSPESYYRVADRLTEEIPGAFQPNQYRNQANPEAHYRTTGGKLQLTTVPDAEWQKIADAAPAFWDGIAQISPRCAKVVEILKKYNESMEKAGPPYRCA